jgi:hypothetical protein
MNSRLPSGQLMEILQTAYGNFRAECERLPAESVLTCCIGVYKWSSYSFWSYEWQSRQRALTVQRGPPVVRAESHQQPQRMTITFSRRELCGVA